MAKREEYFAVTKTFFIVFVVVVILIKLGKMVEFSERLDDPRKIALKEENANDGFQREMRQMEIIRNNWITSGNATVLCYQKYTARRSESTCLINTTASYHNGELLMAHDIGLPESINCIEKGNFNSTLLNCEATYLDDVEQFFLMNPSMKLRFVEENGEFNVSDYHEQVKKFRNMWVN